MKTKLKHLRRDQVDVSQFLLNYYEDDERQWQKSLSKHQLIKLRLLGKDHEKAAFESWLRQRDQSNKRLMD